MSTGLFTSGKPKQVVLEEFNDGDDGYLLSAVVDYEKCEKNSSTVDKLSENSSNVETFGINTDSNSYKSKETTISKEDEMLDDRTPLQKFRPGYLWVSDLTRQSWCEQQLVYSLTVPGIVVENPVMTKGTDLHLARELAVHDKVQVDVTSSEDIWAIKMINLLSAVQAFLAGSLVAREIPIFGTPFDEDIFFVGLIDELRFDLESYTIGLSELKTRRSRSKPSRFQVKQNKLQVWLYKKLFDNLVKGRLKKETVSRHLRLTLNRDLGEEVRRHLEQSGVTCKTLDSLMDLVIDRMQVLTCISDLSIEYVHQDTSESFLQTQMYYNEDEFRQLYDHYIKFWRGQRSTVGVDIEEAWKCQKCDFEAICEWKQRKAEECARNNSLTYKGIA